MNRSPLFYPLNRGMDVEAGGAADLQTDVMRFMAIISMCLVAIFALVQSIPIAPLPQADVVTMPIQETEIDEPLEVPEKAITLVRPEPQKLPPPEDPLHLDRPAPKPMPRTAEPAVARPITTVKKIDVEPAPEPLRTERTPNARSPASKLQKGFTLRFESDAALTRLVERDVVGLYAISESAIHRMSIDAGTMSFWPASAPQRFHEMDVTTVPSSIIEVWRRGQAAGDIKWGVSIPAPMARDLSDYLSQFEGGSIVIGRDGEMRLEQ